MSWTGISWREILGVRITIIPESVGSLTPDYDWDESSALPAKTGAVVQDDHAITDEIFTLFLKPSDFCNVSV